MTKRLGRTSCEARLRTLKTGVSIVKQENTFLAGSSLLPLAKLAEPATRLGRTSCEARLRTLKTGVSIVKQENTFLAGSSNGRTIALGAIYLGSNPSPAASCGMPNVRC